MKYLGSLIWGAILGAAAVMIHNVLVPFGLILSLVGSGVGIWLIGKAWGLDRFKLLASIGWMAVVIRGGLSGVGGELLVQGNTTGNSLVVGGLIVILAVLGARRILNAIANLGDRLSP